MKKNLAFYKTRKAFDEDFSVNKESGIFDNGTLVFIADTHQIYVNETFFSIPEILSKGAENGVLVVEEGEMKWVERTEFVKEMQGDFCTKEYCDSKWEWHYGD